ncbi:MAG: hypothetical protein KIS78_10460 [Labilithrix sp.]|nr:hypothetical protein [Labilithrix sp.]
MRDDGTSVEVRAEHDDRSPIGPDEVLVAKVGSASITLGLTTNEIQAVGFFTSAANAVEPVIVELQRPNRPVSVFEVTLSPPFEAPSISSSAIKIGSPVAVHVRKPTLSADAPPCDDASVADCTALSVQTLYGDECAAGQVAILSLPSADPFPVDFIATPGETAPPCTDWLGLRARRTVTYEDGIVFGDRFRGALVDFTE